MSKLPETVKIGSVVFSVEDVENLMSNGSAVYGLISYRFAKIQLDSELDPQTKRITFMHEVFHAVLEHAGYTEHDEQLLDMIAHVIVMILRDNPSVVSYLTGD